MDKPKSRVLAPRPPPPPPDSSKPTDRFKNLPKLPLVKPSSLGSWYEDAAELEAKVLRGDAQNLPINGADKKSNELLEKKKQLGERLLAQYTQDFESSTGRNGDIKMLVATQRSGTAADKVSAYSIMVGENPIANMRSLDALLGMVTSKVGKRHAVTGFETLKELFLTSLLPDRKLKNLFQRPISYLPESRDGYSLLLFWYWEECLKQRYERFIAALEDASRDTLPVLKDKALKALYALLKGKPEQERRLLSALVNKLGDPDNKAKAASSAAFLLSNLLSQHPNMKAVVIDEVDSFLFRPHLGLQAKYHAVNFLSQLHLSHRGDGPKVAKRLIDVYFAVFKVLISLADGKEKSKVPNSLVDGKGKTDNSRKGVKSEQLNSDKKKPEDSTEHFEKESRILSAILTGVNRAFPFVSSTEVDDLVEVQTPMLFQLVHSKNFNIGVRALLLLDKISSKNQIVSDRFYRALYSKLLFPAALNSSKAEMFIGLLLRAMKRDLNIKRVCAFSKRILQVALQQPPQFACGSLFLLSEVLKARAPLWNKALQNESVDEDLERFEDIVEETSDEPGPVSQTAENPKEDVKDTKSSIKSNSDSEDNEDVEDSRDVASNSFSDDSHTSDEDNDLIINNDSNSHHESVTRSKRSSESSKGSFLPGGYIPRHREPSHCNADRSSWWELEVLAMHGHPSVATMAKTLLSGANIVYNGNPLNDLSLTAFLGKFMEKKPKQVEWHGGSQIEPAKQLDMNKHFIGTEILSLAEEDVPPEDLIFHKFYLNKMTSSKKPKKKKKNAAVEEGVEEFLDVDVDVDGVDESDNDEIEDMLESATRSFKDDGDYDYDDLDEVANEDDEDLIDDASDVEMDTLSEIPEQDEEDGDEVSNYNDIDLEDIDDVSDEDKISEKKRKRKGKTATTSPFASFEEYEHLLDEDSPTEGEGEQKKQKKSKKLKKLDEDSTAKEQAKQKKPKKSKKLNEDSPTEGQAKQKKPKKSKKLNEDSLTEGQAKQKKPKKSKKLNEDSPTEEQAKHKKHKKSKKF